MSQPQVRALLLGAALTIAATIATHAAGSENYPLKLECKSDGRFAAVDSSLNFSGMKDEVGRPALGQLRKWGVKTIIRYYGFPQRSLPEKILRKVEVANILNTFDLATVFQTESDDPSTFMNPDAARLHAERALYLAKKSGQPYRSAIYFGIDGADLHLSSVVAEYRRSHGKQMSPERREKLSATREGRKLVKWYAGFLQFGPKAFTTPLDQITEDEFYKIVARYMGTVAATFKLASNNDPANEYRIGMYCTGGMCEFAERKHLAEFYWVTAEGRDLPEFEHFMSSGKWNIAQQRETVCAAWRTSSGSRGVKFDFNRINPAKADFGQWSSKRPGL